MKSQNFDSKYLENGDRYEVGLKVALSRRTHGLSIGTVTFDLG